MKTLFLASVGLAVTFAAPALAQSFASGSGSGQVEQVRYAGHGGHLRNAYHGRGVSRGNSIGAYAQTPADGLGSSIYGNRWPGAHYDANGYYIDPNSPGRW